MTSYVKRIVVLYSMLGLICSCGEASNSKQVQNAYISEVTNCLAQNHTLINKDDVVRFIKGGGSANVQTLEYISNRQLSTIGLTASVTGLQLGAEFDLEGEKLSTFLMRRKLIDGQWAFKIEEGRLLVPSAISQCEKMRTRWMVINRSLDYEFVQEPL